MNLSKLSAFLSNSKKQRAGTTSNPTSVTTETNLKLTTVKKSSSAKDYFFSSLSKTSPRKSISGKSLEEETNMENISVRSFRSESKESPVSLEMEEKTNEEKLEDFIKNTTVRTRKLSISTKFEKRKNKRISEIPEDEEILYQATISKDLQKMKELLKNSEMNINWKNKQLGNTTALHAACFYNLVSEAEILIEHGADLEILDERSRTALHIASYKGHTEMIAVLLSHKAKVNIRDGFGNAPLHIALRQHHLSLLNPLILAGADINFKTGSGRTIILDSILTDDITLLKFLLLASEKSDVNIGFNVRDELGFTPLLKAVSCGNAVALELLLQHEKVDKMIATFNGQNCFHICSNFNRPTFISLISQSLEESKLKILINEADSLKGKNTPLHVAVKCQNLEVVEEILSLKDHLKLEQKNNLGKTPLALATDLKNQELIQIFKKKGIKK
jgi:ankyrin repeat protein